MWVQDFAGPAGRPPDPEVWAHEVGGGGWGDGQRQVYTDRPGNAALDGEGHLATRPGVRRTARSPRPG